MVILIMHVMNKIQKQGIGRAFFLKLRGMKQEMPFKVRTPSSSALAFYRKVGFGASTILPKDLARGSLFINALMPSPQNPGPGDGGRPARNGARLRKQTSAPGGGRGRSADNGVGLTKPTEPKASEPVLEVRIRSAEAKVAVARERLKKVEIQVKRALKRAQEEVEKANAEVERLKSTADADEVERLESTADAEVERGPKSKRRK